MKVRVMVRLKPGVLDVQGKAVEHGMQDMGFTAFSDVRIGRLIEFNLNEGTLEQQESEISNLCEKLLANPIIENYEIVACD